MSILPCIVKIYPPLSENCPLHVLRYSRGAEGIRTLDLSDANRTLSQLSYSPLYLRI
jgi:hypothetical protein